MMRLSAATTAAVMCLLCAHAVRSQSTSAPACVTASRFGISAGLVWNERRDLSASPLRFGGRGGLIALDYERAFGRFSLESSLSGGTRSLESSSGSAPATERLADGQWHAGLLRRFDVVPPSLGELAFGMDVGTAVALTQHDYRDPARRVSNFVFATTAIGPAISWRQPLLGGTARVHFSTPLAAVVAHSYSAINEQNAATQQRLVSVGTLRGANGAISFAQNETRRVAAVYVYRFSALRYDDVQPVRTLSQTLSVGIVTRFGGGAP
ncbi:MAG: hypothetical protein ABJE47_20680 [bacterium]